MYASTTSSSPAVIRPRRAWYDPTPSTSAVPIAVVVLTRQREQRLAR